MNQKWQRKLDRIHQQVNDLATARIRHMAVRWTRKNPGARLTIIFGMGTELVQINGQDVFEGDPQYSGLIQQAIEDVDKITQGYRLGSPEDLDTNATNPY